MEVESSVSAFFKPSDCALVIHWERLLHLEMRLHQSTKEMDAESVGLSVIVERSVVILLPETAKA